MSTGDDSGFIVPPPGFAPERPREKPVEPERITADDLISLPPGVVDSGTYRMPPSRSPKPSSLDDAPAFFPVGAPGVPVPEAAGKLPAAEEPAIDDATRVAVGRRSAPAWRLTLPDGEQLLLEQTTLVGRDPAHNAEWATARLMSVVDPGKTISKTHAALELTSSGQLVVHDLNSTNGVYLGYPGADETLVEPGAPALVEHGGEVSFGEFTVTVERS